MKRLAIALLLPAALATAGCGGKADVDQATNDLQETAQNTSSDLVDLAGRVPDAAQANVLVNESLDLSNASAAVDNASD